MVLLSFWMAVVTKVGLIADVAKSEPTLTAMLGLFLISVAALLRRRSAIEDSKHVPQRGIPANKVPARQTADFRIPDVPPSRMEVSEQAIELS